MALTNEAQNPKDIKEYESPSLWDRIEARLSRLSTRNNFWYRACSLIWLPFAFKSGITFKRKENHRFRATLPFKRSNRNFYNAMAGAALLGNSEVAAGMFLFPHVGSDYICVCKEMKYKFLLPCHGPATYEVIDSEKVQSDAKKLASEGKAFNIPFEMIVSQIKRGRKKNTKVGKFSITFHCRPKSEDRARKKIRALRKANKKQLS